MDVMGKRCDRCGRTASGDDLKGFVTVSVTTWVRSYAMLSDETINVDLCAECGGDFARGTREALAFHIARKPAEGGT